jgi:surface protein
MSYMFAGGTYSASSPSGSFNNGGSDSIRYWNTSSVINMSNMFLNQPSFQIRLDDWDVSKVTNMSYMFAGVGVYVYWNNGGTGQGYLGRWNTGNVTNMTYMFYNNVGFNRNIGEWNVSKVYDMTGMFQVFSPLKGIYDNEGYNTLSGPTGWNLSGLRRFPSMFAGSGDFNRPIGSWNVASVGLTGAGATQYFATNTGAQSHGNFMTGKVFATGATGFYSSANVDALLIGWASQSVLTARSISFGTAKRTAASNAAYTLLTGTVASGGKGWTITGAGL